MKRSAATTVDALLKELPADRREVMAQILDLVRRNMPKGYREVVNDGVVIYEIPLEQYPDTYNRQPLAFLGAAAMKSHYALYLMSVYSDPKQREVLEKAFEKAGKKMDMGKSCLRFQSLEDLPLKDVAKIIAGTPPKKMIAIYEAAPRTSRRVDKSTSRRGVAKS